MSARDQPSLSLRLWDRLLGSRQPKVTVLDLAVGTVPSQPLSMPASEPRAVSQNRQEVVQSPPDDRRLLRFSNSRKKQSFIGHPVEFLARQTHASIQPGSRNVLGEPGVWVNNSKLHGEVAWEDDPELGLFCREILRIEEAIGRRGRIYDVPYVFEQILQVGRNVVIYQLTNLETCGYLVRGIGRSEFDPVYGLHDLMRKVQEGNRRFDSGEVILMSDRVLESFPKRGNRPVQQRSSTVCR